MGENDHARMRNVKNIWLIGSVLASMLAPPAHALKFEFTYTDEGTGFNDPEHGAERRAALELAGEVLGSTALAAYDGVITVSVNGSESGDLLASAGSNDSEQVPVDGSIGAVLVVPNKIIFGEDLNGEEFDAEVSWNFEDHDWQLDINVEPGENEFDFYSTAYHELVHALGWTDSINFPTGSDGFETGIDEPGAWNVFDSFITDHNGDPLINPETFINDRADEFAEIAQGGSDLGLFFAGENAVAAFDGRLVPLYSPPSFSQGSSVSHLDDDVEALSLFMMVSSTDTGPGRRIFSDIALGVLMDLGYADIEQIDEEGFLSN